VVTTRWERWLGVGRWSLMVGAVAILGATMALRGSDDEGAGDEVVVLETEYFHFTYPGEAKGRALEVIQRADRAYLQICAALGAEPRHGGKVVADLTERSGLHAGIAGWQKLRIDLEQEDPEWLPHVLYHE